MSTKVLRRLLIGFGILAIIADAWLCSLRCASSPPVDWSRFSFALTVQLAVAIVAVVSLRFIREDKPSLRLNAAIGVAIALYVTLAMVRTSFLLSDTVDNKFFPSAGYECKYVRLGA